MGYNIMYNPRTLEPSSRHTIFHKQHYTRPTKKMCFLAVFFLAARRRSSSAHTCYHTHELAPCAQCCAAAIITAAYMPTAA